MVIKYPLLLVLLSSLACSESPVSSQSFHLTKLDHQGRELTEYQGPWSCVRDEQTDLVWEVKTDNDGRHDRTWTYSWYAPSSTEDGVGIADGGTCFDPLKKNPDDLMSTYKHCDTHHFIQAVNNEGLCGLHDWRLPTRQELHTLLDNTAFPGDAMIQEGYFPHSQRSSYWTASPGAPDSGSIWALSFADGHEGSYGWQGSFFVRLVRGAL